MQTKLYNYSQTNRFMIVDNKSIVSDSELYIESLKKIFVIKDKKFIEKLHIDDVLYINEYGVIKRVYESETRSIDFMTTIHCNSNCIMCPISEGARQSKENGHYEWILALIDILPRGVNHICITGGEPTLVGDKLFTITSKLIEKFPEAEYQMLTNGRSCADINLCKQIVKKMPHNTLYGIPLHSDIKERYDEIVQVNGAYEEVVQGIKNLIHYGANVEIRVVVSKSNMDDLYSLSQFIHKNLNGVFCVTFMGLEMMGNAVKNMEKVWIDYEQAAQHMENTITNLIKNGVDVMIYNYPLCCLNRKFWLLAKRSITPYKVKYYDKCDECAVKEACSGFFESTYRVKSTNVIPVV